MRLKGDDKEIKRGSKGRFVKGNVPPLKALGKMPAWWKLKDSLAKKKLYLENPELAEKHSKFMHEYYKSKANREKTRNAVLNFLKNNKGFGRRVSEKLVQYNKKHPETAKKHSTFMKRLWTAGKRKEKSLEMKQMYRKNPEKRKRLSKFRILYYKKHPELKILIGRNTARFFADAKNRKLASSRMIQRYRNHPYLKKKMSIAKQLYYEKHPAALRKLLDYGKKACKRHLKTKQKWLVMSFGEKRIADFCYDAREPLLYESVELNFPEMDPVPDFRMPRFNVFVEFYGGHYKAWKSKVRKNKLYKKYKIPVIFITPSELDNLDYYLLREAERMSKTAICRNFRIEDWVLNKKGLTKGELQRER
jgi:hypothetical protein